MTSEIVEKRLGILQSWFVGVLAFVVVFVVTMTAVMFWQASRLGENAAQLRAIAEETHTALCALKHDIEIRRATLEKFIEENPDGIPGISRAQLDQSLETREATLMALVGLRCD